MYLLFMVIATGIIMFLIPEDQKALGFAVWAFVLALEARISEKK